MLLVFSIRFLFELSFNAQCKCSQPAKLFIKLALSLPDFEVHQWSRDGLSLVLLEIRMNFVSVPLGKENGICCLVFDIVRQEIPVLVALGTFNQE